MPKILYDPLALGRLEKNPERMAVVTMANVIIKDYQAQGFDLTLRQLYYQFVSKGLIPNTDAEYNRLGDIVTEGRMAGLMDWTAIVDRTRHLRSLTHWSDPAALVANMAAEFHIDRWASQPLHVEVWVEKDALLGVIGGACQPLDVPYFSCRGYTSVSELWVASRRLQKAIRRGQGIRILHLGDHDPSGLDMTRDIEDRLAVFGVPPSIRRIALNIGQIQKYGPPPNPTKVSDSRSAKYIAEFGHTCWELDALEPSVLTALIRSAVERRIEQTDWRETGARQAKGRRLLTRVSERWSEVVALVGGRRETP